MSNCDRVNNRRLGLLDVRGERTDDMCSMCSVKVAIGRMVDEKFQLKSSPRKW